MIDHDYRIVTREIAATSSRVKHFIAELSQVHITVDGKRFKAYPAQNQFVGETQMIAVARAAEAFRMWLVQQIQSTAFS